MIKVLGTKSKETLKMPWQNCIAVGRAYELLREDLQSHLRYAKKELGFRYCRFHAVFDDDMGVVVRQPDGSIAYQWHNVNQVYDSLLQMGIRPFVELNPMPAALASGDQTMFAYRMNVTPPKLYEEWGELVSKFVEHLADRYGLEEIRQWYFEVWNEPNLSGFWSGTREEYLKLYDASVFAIKKVDEGLRVGGPASSKGNWIEDIIRHCVTQKVPIDFVSTHLYPQDEYVEYEDRKGSPHKQGEFFVDTIRSIRETVEKSPLPNLEIHWTEWNTQSAHSTEAVTWSDNRYVDDVFAASFIVRNCIALDRECDTMCYWVASDVFGEGGIPLSPFSATYGLMTVHGIPKASFNAFALLKQMKGQKLEMELTEDTPDGCGICITEDRTTTHLLVWNHHMLEVENQPQWKDSVSLPIKKEGKYRLTTARIKKRAGSPWETWLEMGQPGNLSRIEEKLLWAHSQPEYHVEMKDVQNTNIHVDFEVMPNEVLYMELRRMEEQSSAINLQMAEMEIWNRNMGEKSRD